MVKQSFVTLGMVINYKDLKAKNQRDPTGQSRDNLLHKEVKVRALCPRSLGDDQEKDPAVIKSQKHMMLQSLP